MTKEMIREILEKTDCVRFSGTEAEKDAAGYLEGLCAGMGVKAYRESFNVDTAKDITASLAADGREIPVEDIYDISFGDLPG